MSTKFGFIENNNGFKNPKNIIDKISSSSTLADVPENEEEMNDLCSNNAFLGQIKSFLQYHDHDEELIEQVITKCTRQDKIM